MTTERTEGPGSIIQRSRTVTGSVTLGVTDTYVSAKTDGATLTLPTAPPNGQYLSIEVDAGPNSSVTIDGNGKDIDEAGQSEFTLFDGETLGLIFYADDNIWKGGY